jgi:competence protein ComEA
MGSRHRGAALLLLALLAGRGLDRLDLPFERRPEPGPDSSRTRPAPAPAPDAAAAAPAPRPAEPATADSSAPRPGAARSSASRSKPPAGRVSINRATASELQALPGVGPVLAERIVAFRAAHGPLRSLADLQRVQGIGARSAARLAPHVRFD